MKNILIGLCILSLAISILAIGCLVGIRNDLRAFEITTSESMKTIYLVVEHLEERVEKIETEVYSDIHYR